MSYGLQALDEAAKAKSEAKKALDEVSRSHDLVLKIKESLKDMGLVDLQQLQELQDLLDKVRRREEK